MQTAGPGIHPLNLDVQGPATVPRWRPLANWVLIIPHAIWLDILGLGSALVTFLGWFAIVLTGRLPDSWGDYNMAVLRYQWRVAAYLLAWTEVYPSFSPAAGYLDPGDFPAVLYCARPMTRNRVTVLFRVILFIPHYVVLAVAGIAAEVVMVLAWFAVLFTGRWPEGMRRFAIGYFRYALRVHGYMALVTDVYPPFSFEP
jgi:hypothetical protein